MARIKHISCTVDTRPAEEARALRCHNQQFLLSIWAISNNAFSHRFVHSAVTCRCNLRKPNIWREFSHETAI